MERLRCLTVGVRNGDRVAIVATLTQLGQQRQLAKQRHLKLFGQFLSTTTSEDFVSLAIVAGEPAHVLDDALDRKVDFASHSGRQRGDLLRGWLRSGDHIHLAPR